MKKLLATLILALSSTASAQQAYKGDVSNNQLIVTNEQDLVARTIMATNKTEKLYAPGSATTWIDGAGNKYIISNFWNMTFSADFAGVNNPAQTNYLFTALDQYYYESLGMGRYWRMAPGEIRYLPSTLTSTRLWVATTNSLVLDPDTVSGAEGYAYIQAWSTTNLVATLATEANLATKPSYQDTTNIVRNTSISSQIWTAAGTNATYQLTWDVTNMTFKVEEILP